MVASRAAVLTEPGVVPTLADIEVRDPVGDEVRIKIGAVGICHTDVSLAARWPARRMPIVFGHEGCGVVEAVGPGATVAVGQRVVLTFNSCGVCPHCAAGRPAYCDRSTTLNMRGDRADGSGALSGSNGPVVGGFFGQSSFSTYAIATQRNTVAIGEQIDAATAAPLGCSVQTGVGAVLNALRPGAGDSIAIFGAGAVGLSAVMGARIAGCRTIVAVDPIAERRSLATDLGATHVIDPTECAVVEAVVEHSAGGVGHALDTTAIPAVLADAVAALRTRGQLGIVGLGAPTAELPVGLVMGKGLSIRGVVEGDSVPQTFIPELVDLYSRGDLPLEKLITTYEFSNFDSAWQAARSGSVVKPVLTV